MTILMTANGLCKRYKERQVLNNISFSCYRGETLAIMGHNGAGKTTLLNALCHVISCDEGAFEWYLDGKPFHKVVGVQRQMNYFEASATVEALFKLYKTIADVSVGAKEYLETFHMAHLLKAPVERLSFGERQKLNLALALLHNPQILILDEVTSGVDLMAKREIWNLIQNLKETRNLTVIMVTHDMEEVKLYADRMMVLKEGEVKCLMTVETDSNLESVYIDIHKGA